MIIITIIKQTDKLTICSPPFVGINKRGTTASPPGLAVQEVLGGRYSQGYFDNSAVEYIK